MTLARHRGLFRRWLWFAGGLMPGGRLSRRDTELVILRVAHNAGSEYEWGHHERIGRRVGLSAEEIARVREGAAAPGWSTAPCPADRGRRRPPRRPDDRRRALGGAGRRARRRRADRALHAGRPLRDAGDDPEQPAGRARLRGRDASPVKSLRGRRCLITGAASGIGRATAIAAAAEGAELFLTDIQARGAGLRGRGDPRRGRPGLLREGGRPHRSRRGRRDGGRGPRRARQHGRRHERRRDRRLGEDRGPRARSVAQGDRGQPDRRDRGARVLRAADDRGRSRRPRGQRLLGGGSLRPRLARPLQRHQVRPAGRLRGAPLRPAPPRHRRQPRLPGRGEDSPRRHGGDRRGRSRRPLASRRRSSASNATR